MDKLSPQQRHANMAAIRSKDTKPEMIVRRGLWKRGFRYRLNDKRLPGHPDLVLRKYRTCIFVNGCFWHGHKLRMAQSEKLKVKSEKFTFDFESSECCKMPNTNREFWVAKIRRNKERDKEELRKLAEMGWHCITVWECELKPSRREETLDSIAFTLNHIWLQDRAQSQGTTEKQVTPYYIYEDGDMPLPMAAENMEDVRGKMDDGLSSTDRFADVSKMIE